MSSANVAVRTDGLTKRFGDVVAVRDLDLTVESGEVFGFLGPNGAGKSTTIDLLLGFLDPSAGTARVLGHDVTTDSRAIRRRLGLLPEGYGVYANLTGREHVASAIETKGAADDPDEILDRVGLDPADARRPAGDYSKGMRQRMALGVALVGSPDLLVLDEPSSGLDPKGVKLLREIVDREVDRGATVFFSSHVLDEVDRVCDRVGIMQNGELAAVNTVEDLRTELDTGAVVTARVERVPDGIEGGLREVEGVTDVAVEDRRIEVTCTRPTAKMPTLRRIDDRTTVTDVAVEEASLEAVFEEYTASDGPEPTDDAGAGATASEGPSTSRAGGD